MVEYFFVCELFLCGVVDFVCGVCDVVEWLIDCVDVE